MSDKIKSNEDVVKETSKILENNREIWDGLYNGKYLNYVIDNEKFYSKIIFQVDRPLLCYSSLSMINNREYDLRCYGISVGKIRYNQKKNEITLHVTDSKAKQNKDVFGFKESKPLKGVEWLSEDATSFRRFFSSEEVIKPGVREAQMKAIILQDLYNRVHNITPITLCGKYYELTTPLKGSNHKPKFCYNKSRHMANGGGIDILARANHSSNRYGNRIAIIELKDENNTTEPQRDVMIQALIYATFIAYLLHSSKGKEWYNKVFGKRKDVPSSLHLDVVTLMPKPTDEKESNEGEFKEIPIEFGQEKVTLHPYSMYYEENKGVLEYSGNFIESLKK